MDTYFAPAIRTERRKFKNQIASITHNPIMNTLLKTASGMLIVLNEDRQIVALNHVFLDEMGIDRSEDVLGLRLGETLHCTHAFKKPNGCGTTEACLSCGAAIAVMTAIRDNKENEHFCALLSDKKGAVSDICLRIKAKPIALDKYRWILIYARDVTRQHFWHNLEQVFFHDISNILTTLDGNARLLEVQMPQTDEMAALRNSIDRLMQEISMQRAFSEHRQEGVKIRLKTTSLQDIKQEINIITKGHTATAQKNVHQVWPQEDIYINTDPMFASRIAGNMLINACEASAPGDTIRLTVRATADHVFLEVWNKAHIPEPIKKRIFQKHFSTKKGSGRGIGTYSMKLFGEHYLGGQVNFTSSAEEGTTFTFALKR